VPEQKITVEQALIAYTQNAAYASLDEDKKGSIEKGKLADFVIIDRDIRTIAPEQIKDASILATYVGGKKVSLCKINVRFFEEINVRLSIPELSLSFPQPMLFHPLR